MSPTDDSQSDSDILKAFFTGVTTAFREALRGALLQRQDQLKLKTTDLVPRLGVTKSTISEMLNHGISDLRTVVRLLLALEVDHLGQLELPAFSALTRFGWLTAMQSFDPAGGLTLEEVELLREMVMSKDWARAQLEHDRARLAVLAEEFAQAVSARLGTPITPRSSDSLVRLSQRWGDAFIRCLDAILIWSEGQP